MTLTSASIAQCTRSHSKVKGFVLVTAMALLTLIVLVLITLVTLLRIHQSRINTHLHRSLARKHAMVGLDIAIAELQATTGSDRISTSPASTIFPDSTHPHWTCAQGDEITWLVSHKTDETPDPTVPIEDTQSIQMVGGGTVGEETKGHVFVEKLPIRVDAKQCGAYGFWIGELNTKANLSIIDKTKNSTLTSYEKNVLALSFPQKPETSVVFEDSSKLNDPDFVSKLIVQQQLYEVEFDKPTIQKHFHDITTYSMGLLTNPIVGGFKINLTDQTYRDSLITEKITHFIHPNLLRKGEEDLTPESFKIAANHFFLKTQPPSTGGMIETFAPMLTEFRLSVGIFSNTTGMSRGDYFHRARFHIHTEWLNPFPYDIGFQYPNGYYLFIDHLPEIQITNTDADLHITADLGDIDENLRNNTANESNFNTYLKFASLIDPTEKVSYGIESGRVYKMTSPNDSGSGLARTLSEEEWANVSTDAPADGSRPLVEYKTSSKTEYFPPIYLDDEIQITSKEDSFKIDLTLSPISDEVNASLKNSWDIPMGTDTSPTEYIENNGVSLRLINIPFSKINFTLPGSVYPRHTSSYTEADFRIAFHFRLKDDPTSLNTLAEQLSLNNFVLDFDDPSISELFEITSDPREAATLAVGFSGLDLFYDSINEKNTYSPEEYEFNLYDIPIIEPVSVGVFSQIHFRDCPYPWIGSPQASVWNQVYDSYYFSGTQASDEWQEETNAWSPTKHALNFLTNNRVVATASDGLTLPTVMQLTQWDGAQHCYIKGMFNIHASSVKAWEIALTNTIVTNELLQITDSEDEDETVPNVFSRLPFASPQIKSQLSDSSIAKTNNPQKKHFRQASRSLDEGNWINSLAVSIVSEIQKHVQSNGLFRSMSELANSGVLKDAIDQTTIDGKRINDGISPLAPMYLKQSDLLAQLAPFVTTRSDSFVIRAYGESIDSKTQMLQAKTMCEAIVQRTPNYIDPENSPNDLTTELNPTNEKLGRRYKIVQFRWLRPHEI